MKRRLVATVLLAFLVVGCEEKGASRASADELVGVYQTEFQLGSERITLNRDMTFVQVFTSTHGQITTKGRWTRSNQFLGPTDVLLLGNYASEDQPQDSSPIYGQRNLIVHKEHGKLKLALNEAADWYYDRVE